MKKIGILTAVAYLACIPAANWMVAHLGPVQVWPGILAPAGVLLAGVALTLRDLTQVTLGRAWVLLAILAGSAFSLVVAPPALALASAAAFLLAELLDMVVYSRLERRGMPVAVLVSNVAGLLVDSVVFLWLAFGSLAFLPGQVIGKLEMTVVAVALIALTRPLVRRAA